MWALDWSDIKIQPDCILVKVYHTKQVGPKKASEFVISAGKPKELIEKYMDCFTSLSQTGRCVRKLSKEMKGGLQVIDKNTMGTYPSKIAEFLELPEPEKYTGHSFRRSAATLLSNHG